MGKDLYLKLEVELNVTKTKTDIAVHFSTCQRIKMIERPSSTWVENWSYRSLDPFQFQCRLAKSVQYCGQKNSQSILII